MRVGSPKDRLGNTLETLRNSGKYKEHYVMKRKDGGKIRDGQLSFLEKEEAQEQSAETAEQKSENGNGAENGNGGGSAHGGVFILENGRIEPVTPESYLSSTLYQTVESFSVECRLVKPEEPGSMVFEGKKPSKKTVPILVGRDGECVLLNSWEELESEPSRLANAREVLGALPVKQVFVLKRK
jgi:hypothetical protein